MFDIVGVGQVVSIFCKATGVGNFLTDLPGKLPTYLIQWLTKDLPANIRLTPPSSIDDVAGWTNFVLQFVGLDWGTIQQKLVTAVGPGNVALLGQAYDLPVRNFTLQKPDREPRESSAGRESFVGPVGSER